MRRATESVGGTILLMVLSMIVTGCESKSVGRMEWREGNVAWNFDKAFIAQERGQSICYAGKASFEGSWISFETGLVGEGMFIVLNNPIEEGLWEVGTGCEVFVVTFVLPTASLQKAVSGYVEIAKDAQGGVRATFSGEFLFVRQGSLAFDGRRNHYLGQATLGSVAFPLEEIALLLKLPIEGGLRFMEHAKSVQGH